MPLRAVDVAELEYREWILEANGSMLDNWAQSSPTGDFAGYYLDHRAGGRFRIGFVSPNQEASLSALAGGLPLVASERLDVYPATPTVRYASLVESEDLVIDAIEANPELTPPITSVYFDEQANTVRVKTQNVAQTQAALNSLLGPQAPVAVEYEAGAITPLSGRFRNKGRMRAGDSIFDPAKSRCTAGFGAYEKTNHAVNGGKPVRNSLLTAGHCSFHTNVMYRSPYPEIIKGDERKEIGEVTRDAWNYRAFANECTSTDALAIRIEKEGLIPRRLFTEDSLWVRPATPARVGNEVCFSGQASQNPEMRNGWTLVEPLLHPPKMRADAVPGILDDPDLEPHPHISPLSLKTGAPLLR